MYSAWYPSHAGRLDADGGVERALGDGGRLVDLGENALADRLPDERDADHDRRCARAEVARAVAHARVGERRVRTCAYAMGHPRNVRASSTVSSTSGRNARKRSSSGAKWCPRRWRTEAIAGTTISCVTCMPFGAGEGGRRGTEVVDWRLSAAEVSHLVLREDCVHMLSELVEERGVGSAVIDNVFHRGRLEWGTLWWAQVCMLLSMAMGGSCPLVQVGGDSTLRGSCLWVVRAAGRARASSPVSSRCSTSPASNSGSRGGEVGKGISAHRDGYRRAEGNWVTHSSDPCGQWRAGRTGCSPGQGPGKLWGAPFDGWGSM